MNMSKLTKGKIPIGQVCPYKNRCQIATAGQCHHTGKDHQTEFSCGLARGFDLETRYRTPKGDE